MIKHFINFEWKQFFRSSYWQKSVGLNILLVFIALYFMLSFLILGFALYPLLKDNYPDSDPLIILNGFIFYWFLADLVMRFFFQKLPVMNIKPLLTLPVKKSSILNYVLGKSVLSFFNFLPLFAIVPFGVILLTKGYATSTVLSWMLLIVICTLIINYINFIIENVSAESEFSFLPIIILTGSLFALNYFEIISFSTLLSDAINSIINNPVLLLALLGLLGFVYFANYNILSKKLYIDGSLKSKASEAVTSDLSWTRRFGDVAPFLQLDLKLIWRNKRPRSTILLLVLSLFYGLIFYPNPTYQNMIPMFIFVGIFITGIFLINFGQFIPAWDSAYYKMLMSQNIQYKLYLKSKFTLMAASAVILFVLSIPYVYFGWNILLIHFAAMIYNIGVNTHVLMFAGSFNRKKIDLTQRAAFNYQGTGAVQWLVGIPLLLVPILIFYIPYKLINFESGIAALVLFGVLGIVFHQKIMNYITQRYLDSKYKTIQAFDQNN